MGGREEGRGGGGGGEGGGGRVLSCPSKNNHLQPRDVTFS